MASPAYAVSQPSRFCRAQYNSHPLPCCDGWLRSQVRGIMVRPVCRPLKTYDGVTCQKSGTSRAFPHRRTFSEGGFVTMAQLLDRDALQPQGRGEREKAIK